ncbi:DUF1707 domain-containing protein [Nocardiopsis sediminis]|uniref:DUF1707 domain-containing protein n=1 Tax=Nocardiopsis sediminis TaxID=1778267 RepID=A0ABV8FTV1_9ACTN
MDAQAAGTGPDGAHGRMRASDRDRDQVAEILREAAAEGRITLDELDERLDRTFAARTYAELDPLTADLPVAGAQAPVAPAPAYPPAAPGPPLVLRSSIAGSIVRRGVWEVPARVRVVNPYGVVRLDFREATLLSDVVELELGESWGEARVVLPDGATAAVDVETSWLGSVDSRVPPAPAPPAPHFVLKGSVKGGSLKIRYGRSPGGWLSGDIWDDWL